MLAVEPGDTSLMKFGLAIDVGTTSVVTTLIELESGEQLASVSSLNPQAVFGGDLMSRIAFAQFNPGNLRKLHTRIVGLLNQHIEQVCRESGVLAKWIYKVVVVGNTCMHHLLLGIDPSWVGLAPYAPVMRHPFTGPLACDGGKQYAQDYGKRREKEAETLARLTGWGLDDVHKKMGPSPVAEPGPKPGSEWWRDLWKK